MGKMMKDFLTKIFNRLIDIFHLSEMRVFHQILMIICLLLLFLIVQGLSGVGIIDKMQQTTTQVYNQNAQFMSSLYTVETGIENIKNSYLLILFKIPQPGLISFDNKIEDLRYFIKRLKDPQFKELEKEANDISKYFGEVEKILKSPPSIENYDLVSKKLYMISSILVGLKENARRIASITTVKGKEYSANAKWISIIIVLLGGLLAIIIGLLSSASISRPLSVMEAASKALAKGDLTKDINVSGCREAKEAVKGLNQAIIGLRDLVQGINDQSWSLLSSSKELKTASTDTGLSSAQIAASMDELAKATSEETIQINQAVDTINQLSELVKKVSLDTESIAVVSEKVAHSAQAGQKATNDIAGEINELYVYTKEVAQVINELSSASGEIGEIVSMIQGIAEQTTLLALNAAIEAARAGEQGRGFSVVADETGKLAEQSKQAAKMIADLIVQMTARIEHAVSVMHQGIERVEVGKDLASKATVTFEEIFKVLKNNVEQINVVARSAKQMFVSNENVIGAITTIASISEERMASTQEISASTEEQCSSMEEVTALAENLARIADKLKQSVAVFEIKQ